MATAVSTPGVYNQGTPIPTMPVSGGENQQEHCMLKVAVALQDPIGAMAD